MNKNPKLSDYRDMIISNNEAMKYIKTDIDTIKKDLKDFIKSADDKYARKADFIFWRNAIVSIISAVIILIISEIISIIYK